MAEDTSFGKVTSADVAAFDAHAAIAESFVFTQEPTFLVPLSEQALARQPDTWSDGISPLYEKAPNYGRRSRYNDAQRSEVVELNAGLMRTVREGIVGAEDGEHNAIVDLVVSYFKDPTNKDKSFADALTYVALDFTAAHLRSHFSSLPIAKIVFLDNVGSMGIGETIASSMAFLYYALQKKLTPETVDDYASLADRKFIGYHMVPGEAEMLQSSVRCPGQGTALKLRKAFALAAVQLVELEQSDQAIGQFLAQYRDTFGKSILGEINEKSTREYIGALVESIARQIYDEGTAFKESL